MPIQWNLLENRLIQYVRSQQAKDEDAFAQRIETSMILRLKVVQISIKKK